MSLKNSNEHSIAYFILPVPHSFWEELLGIKKKNPVQRRSNGSFVIQFYCEVKTEGEIE